MINHAFITRTLALRRSESDEGLTLETSAFESLYGGQFTLSTQLIKSNYPIKLAILLKLEATRATAQK